MGRDSKEVSDSVIAICYPVLSSVVCTVVSIYQHLSPSMEQPNNLAAFTFVKKSSFLRSLGLNFLMCESGTNNVKVVSKFRRSCMWDIFKMSDSVKLRKSHPQSDGHWNRMPREAQSTPYLDVLKTEWVFNMWHFLKPSFQTKAGDELDNLKSLLKVTLCWSLCFKIQERAGVRKDCSSRVAQVLSLLCSYWSVAYA